MRILSFLSLTIFSIIFMASPKDNALANISWNGIINAPDAMNGNLKFSEDTLFVFVDTQLIETSTYAVSSDTITVVKFSGLSPCLNEIGTYTFQITNDILTIKPLTDLCDARYNVFSPLGYVGDN